MSNTTRRTTAVPAPPTDLGAVAEQRMIDLCAEYVALLARYNAGEGEEGEGPLWDRIVAVEAALGGWQPVTFAGAVAAAKVADASGRQDWSDKVVDAVVGLGRAA